MKPLLYFQNSDQHNKSLIFTCFTKRAADVQNNCKSSSSAGSTLLVKTTSKPLPSYDLQALMTSDIIHMRNCYKKGLFSLQHALKSIF